MNQNATVNPDLVKERQNATIDVEKMKSFLGEMIYQSPEKHQLALKYRKII